MSRKIGLFQSAYDTKNQAHIFSKLEIVFFEVRSIKDFKSDITAATS